METGLVVNVLEGFNLVAVVSFKLQTYRLVFLRSQRARIQR